MSRNNYKNLNINFSSNQRVCHIIELLKVWYQGEMLEPSRHTCAHFHICYNSSQYNFWYYYTLCLHYLLHHDYFPLEILFQPKLMKLNITPLPTSNFSFIVQHVLIHRIPRWNNSARCFPFPIYHDTGETQSGHRPQIDGPQKDAEHKTISQPHNQ